jgi:hypothetical protein
MNDTTVDYSLIKGWGIDADPENDPTYPMKHRTDAEQTGYSWTRPPQQPQDVEVLQSIERPNLSATFGTASPPQGLSGMIRRWAFKSSESSYAHWLPLIVADRINVIEGIVDDFKQGHIPNIFGEKGYKAIWKHDKKGLFTTIAVSAVLIAGVVALLNKNNEEEDDD